MAPLGPAMLGLMSESAMERAENRVKGLKRRVGLERHGGFGRAIEQHPLPSGFVVATPDEHLGGALQHRATSCENGCGVPYAVTGERC